MANIKHLFFFSVLGFYSLTTVAQPKIALEHNGTASFFTDIPTAVAAATGGDTIYLPGASYSAFTIDKKLTIIGVGHHPDSTSVTSRTLINGGIILMDGCAYSYISGLQVAGSIVILESAAINISHLTISRCNIQGGINFNNNSNGSSWSIFENIIGVYSFCGNCSGGASIATSSPNILISNNIILGALILSNSTITNNISFREGYDNTGHGFNACLVDNNIFKQILSNQPQLYGSNCILHNNINGPTHDSNGNQNYGNIWQDINFDSLFVQYTPGWDYSDDFHLLNPAFNTGGTNGTAIGIYGGPFPWKTGSLPFNPHINLKAIAPTTNNTGNLPVQIRVRAQNN